MAPSRFRHRAGGGGSDSGGGGPASAREKREVTPFAVDFPAVEDPAAVATAAPSLTAAHVAEDNIPAEWMSIEAPPNFTWVGQDELAGMGWPKSRDHVKFLVEQGIDHLVTLSADKIPPHYAFPELKWSLIPVEDFHGPAIRDIKKFLNIMDDARSRGWVSLFLMKRIAICSTIFFCEQVLNNKWNLQDMHGLFSIPPLILGKNQYIVFLIVGKNLN